MGCCASKNKVLDVTETDTQSNPTYHHYHVSSKKSNLLSDIMGIDGQVAYPSDKPLDKSVEANGQFVDPDSKTTYTEVEQFEKGGLLTQNESSNQVFRYDEDQEILDWKSTIKSLLANVELTNYAMSRKLRKFKHLIQLADFISKSPAQNDLEKAWLLFYWMAENIPIDTIGVRDGRIARNDAEGVLKSGNATSEGYANLYEQICKLINIECKTVSGIAKSFGYVIGSKLSEENHAWNAIKLYNKWYYVEPMWACGTITSDFEFEKKFQPYYFLTPPEIFKENHYSESFQLHAKLTLSQFEKNPQFELIYHLMGLKSKDLNSEIIEIKKSPLIVEFTTMENIELTGVANKPNSNTETSAIFVQKDESVYPRKQCLFIFLEDKSVNYNFQLFGREEGAKEKNFLFKCILRLVNDEFNLAVPKYNIDLGKGIKLLSHQSKLIYFEENPLRIEFAAPSEYLFMANVKTLETGFEINNAVLIQRDPKDNVIVYINLPQSRRRMNLSLFVKTDILQENFPYLTSFYLIKTKPIVPEKSVINTDRFIKLLNQDKIDFFIYEPVTYFLKQRKTSKFKLYVKNARGVALVQGETSIMILKSDKEEEIYSFDRSFEKLGHVSIMAKTSDSNNFECICNYEVIA